jgi:hypothetical protein
MGRVLIAKIPGQKNINDQFIAGNLGTTLRHLKKLLEDGKGDYSFGALTAMYYGYTPGTPDYINWMDEVYTNYDKPARDKIKEAVIAAVTHQSKPLPITLHWDPTGSPKEVVVSQSSSSYTIEIIGYPAPAKSALADRRNKKKT